MKKITLLIIIVFAFTFKAYAQFPENFQGSTTIPAGWSSFVGANGLGTVENWQIESSGADNYALVIWEAVTVGQIAEDWLVTPQITVDANNSFMTFDLTDLNEVEYFSQVSIRISTNSQTTHADFTTVGTITEADITGGFQGFILDLATDYLNQSVYVAFVMENNDGDGWALDNVDVVPDANAPNPVTTPNPTDGAINVPLAVDTDHNGDLVIDANDAAYTFTWEDAITGDAPNGYTLNIGTTNPPTTAINVSSSGILLYGLAYSTTYYWEVVAYNVGGNAFGSSIWSFTTEADPNLSIKENYISELKIYPNPTKDVIKIDTPITIDNVSIINQLGQRVLEVNKAQIFKNKINLSTLSKGVYYMTITSDNKSKTIKVVKE